MTDQLLQKILSNAGSLAAIAAVVIVTVILYALARRGLSIVQSRGALAEPVALLLRVFLRWTFTILALLLVFQQIGILQNVWAVLLAILAAVSVGFVAVWSVLSNVLCTLLVLIYRPFTIGDKVRIPADGIGGKVIDLNMMFTTLAGDDGELVQIPNNVFFQKPMLRVPGEIQTGLYEQLTAKNPTL
jgi:small-conductance mechanosensitive channel